MFMFISICILNILCPATSNVRNENLSMLQNAHHVCIIIIMYVVIIVMYIYLFGFILGGASDGPSLHKVPRIIPMNPQRYEYLAEMKKGELRHLSHNVSVFTFDSADTNARYVVAPNHLYFRGF